MHFPFLLACILALACISTARLDACNAYENLPSDTITPKPSKFAILLTPVRSLLDFWFHRYPRSSSRKDTKNLPWTITTHPAYANQTEDGWNVHVHGNLHHRQSFTTQELNEMVARTMPRTRLVKKKWKIWQHNYHTLTEVELAQARPLMHDIASVPIKDGVIGLLFKDCGESFVLPIRTNAEGSFYGTVIVPDECVPSTSTNDTTTTTIPTAEVILAPCNIHTLIDENVNNTADVFFVPPKGLTIIADLDDTLRVMNVWNPKQTLLNTFARPLRPWRDMPDVFHNLKRRIEVEGQSLHFHYLTDAPEMIASSYTPALTDFYPPGSFDFRPVNFTSTKEMLHARHWSVKRLMESYPDRRFIAIGDTINNMDEFPEDLTDFYPQIQCILVRDIMATERSNWVTPDTRKYIDLLPTEYLFFRIPEDLYRLSAKHLASLSPMNESDEPTHGCFDSQHKLRQSMSPSPSRWNGFKSAANMYWWNIKCSFMWYSYRPSPKCPWDRLANETYHDGAVEPEVRLEPFTDNLPVGELEASLVEHLEADNSDDSDDEDPEIDDQKEDDEQGDD